MVQYESKQKGKNVIRKAKYTVVYQIETWGRLHERYTHSCVLNSSYQNSAEHMPQLAKRTKNSERHKMHV